MLDYTYSEYLEWLDKKANKWYKKLFVNFVKKHFPEFMTRQYRNWKLKMIAEKFDHKSFTSMTNEDFIKLAALIKN